MNEADVRAIVRDELAQAGAGRTGSLAAQIRQAREAAGLSQKELAGRFGNSQPHMHRIEVGRGFLTCDDLDRLAALLGKRVVLVDLPEEVSDAQG
ncbi:hypothetical protein Sme01_03820 [Sphaerisporangium melleum]|uniref:HTH cro/C1-type domain-containing protein n=1 Tax=Sphaerisporangium melleum TaxID=321316 RepID=A0A917VC90_9ACTN|nr:helix-turn-helix transcriptional regulator [Sphaerisporangium melleum]GGK61948.1 hypothetical protein GCM10007964_01370 [Sphaerisporangium melleum]GII67906.1 hypothetical protein Sme01_03820 [Sphaerisporangium melleum]